MDNTILCKEGYLVPKVEKFKLFIENAKNELTVEPAITCMIGKKKSTLFSVYNENDKFIAVPKYYGLKKFGKPDINEELIGRIININFKGILRNTQQEIINYVIPYIDKNDGGILCLPCAAGKTVLALYIITHYKIKTLVIVHKTFLLNQWRERAEQFTNAKIGIIQQNKIDINDKDIVIGMLQSIAKEKYDPDIFKEFGMVIFDEAHHAPSQYFSKALPLISCKKTIGLSATPKRSDKLEKVLYWYFGDIMYKTENKQNDTVLVNYINYNIEHEKFVELKLYTGDINRAATINNIVSIKNRNKFIVNMIIDILKENNRKIIILSDRIEHLKLLNDRLNNKITVVSDFYIGGMKQAALKKSELAQVIFASYGMASEALDIPDLNTLFLVTARKEVEQAVGRILRKIVPGIRPIIYDFVDQLPSFINQGRCRKRFYNKMGFQINIINVENNIIINKENNNIIDEIDYDYDNDNNNCDFLD